MPERTIRTAIAVRQYENSLARQVAERLDEALGQVLASLYRNDPTKAGIPEQIDKRVNKIRDLSADVLKKVYTELFDELIAQLTEFGYIIGEAEAKDIERMITEAFKGE